MSFCTARVAPEKAVFRPALPPHSMPEFTGEREMATRKSYAEQIKHPNWQRRRLEALEAAQFKCQACEDTETTLHVHHKRYVKGREVWEYELDELQVLCEVCHADHHETHKLLEEVIAGATSYDPTRTALGLVAGFLDAAYDLDAGLAARARDATGAGFDVGRAAYLVAVSNRYSLAVAFRTLSRNQVNSPVLDDMLQRWLQTPPLDAEGNIE